MSKFQNRLVGTIVLVALGVIILPGLLDGQKKYYRDESAAIPLVPKPGDRDEPDMLPAATQALPSQPPERAAEGVRAGDVAAPSLDPLRIPVNSSSFDDVQEPVVATKPQPKSQPKPQPQPQQRATTPTPPPVKPQQQQPPQQQATLPVPAGKAYVVQLGVLKNADKVNEIVGKLRASGLKIYTSPSAPVQSKIIRILVSPDASKDKLKGQLGDLQQVSGLSGVAMSFTPN